MVKKLITIICVLLICQNSFGAVATRVRTFSPPYSPMVADYDVGLTTNGKDLFIFYAAGAFLNGLVQIGKSKGIKQCC